MCGIAGYVGVAGAELAERHVQRMLTMLRHRGPDGEHLQSWPMPLNSTVVLGHRRLKIIDLSDAAAQPMSSSSGACTITYNGEIYNYVELRRELEREGIRFRTQSDTEVLLEAWCTWGPERTLARVEGMFAFAMLDERQQSLTLVRDQFAMKPLYYAITNTGFWFASEIPALLGVPGVGRNVSANGLADFLVTAVNNHPGTTLFRDVCELPAAHSLTLPLHHAADVKPQPYWAPPGEQQSNLSFDDAAESLREQLSTIVRMHVRSDVPIGALLSGGVDSSSVVSLMRETLGTGFSLDAFSYRGDNGAFDEGRFIDAAAGAAGANVHALRLTPDEWVRDADALLRSQGEPFGSLAIYGQRRLYQLAAESGVKVVLDGQGADEYFAGYPRFLSSHILSMWRQRQWSELGARSRGYSRMSGMKSTLLTTVGLAYPRLRKDRASRSTLLSDQWRREQNAVVTPPFSTRARSVLRAHLGSEVHAPSIPWVMRYADRNAMAFSLENRSPFLTPRLVEFVLSLPERYLVDESGLGKRLLRRAMRGLVPDVILSRRDNVGFDVPMQAWLRTFPNLADLVGEAARIPAVNAAQALQYETRLRAGGALSRSDAFLAWRLVTLALWSRTFDVTYT